MKKLKRKISLFFMIVTAIAMVEQLRKPVEERDWHGEIMFVPYDFRPFSVKRVQERWWNPDDPRLFTPHVFGAGWSINLYQAKELLTGASRNKGDG